MKPYTRLRILFTLCAIAFSTQATAAGGVANPSAPIDFNRDIRPILSNNCFQCHGPAESTRKADLRLDIKEGALGDRDGDRVIVPGNADKSELIRRITHKYAFRRMPPQKSKLKLSEDEKKLLIRWIDQGAPWAEHWAYITPKRPPLPKVKNETWPRNAIDYFVLSRLEGEKLSPSPEARKETLIRRVTLDLTGIPPTSAEVDAFLKDTSPNAYEKVVDRLLNSSRYGERMAWEWLDAGRYADTNGFQGDPTRTMWPWRDWLIEAINDNMPFDQFTIEMLAGDQLPDATLDQIIATGFHRNHMMNGEGGRIAEETRVENVFDRAETTATVWLGLTMTCCRCHDHKYDPISQKEYYQLYAFFNNTSESGRVRSGQAPPVVEWLTEERKAERAKLNKEFNAAAANVTTLEEKLFPRGKGKPVSTSERVAKTPKAIRAALDKSPQNRDVKSLQQLISHFRKMEPEYTKALQSLVKARQQRDNFNRNAIRVMVMDDLPKGKKRETFILTRGLYNKQEDKVSTSLPSVLPPLIDGEPRSRLDLAKWLVHPDHPLTARVTVNRYWQMFFEKGIVASTEDFGVQGKRPTHPDLLDWLAVEFVSSGWDVKHIHRLIVTSATYRQTSKVSKQLLERDPENKLLARASRFRMPSWMLRDQALAVSGLLVDKIGGPPVRPYQPSGIWAEATFGKIRYQQDHGNNLYRRSLYTFWRRIVGPTMFFDTAARQTCSVKPTRTNTPLHALVTMNDVTFVEAARVLAERAMLDAKTTAERITLAFRRATAREPSAMELKILTNRWNILKSQFAANPKSATELLQVGEAPRNESLDTVEHAAYASLYTLILNLDEALTRE